MDLDFFIEKSENVTFDISDCTLKDKMESIVKSKDLLDYYLKNDLTI